jgi:hypothetical protein
MSAFGGKADINNFGLDIAQLIGGDTLFVRFFGYISIKQGLTSIKRSSLAGA